MPGVDESVRSVPLQPIIGCCYKRDKYFIVILDQRKSPTDLGFIVDVNLVSTLNAAKDWIKEWEITNLKAVKSCLQ